ncbi:MAG: DUF2341 domain-containing protein [bacterium]
MFSKLKFSVITILAIIMMSSLVSASPSNDWDYVQELSISNMNDYELNDFQVTFTLTSSNVGPNFNWSNNGDDLRFISSDGIEYDYFIESWDSSGNTASITVEASNLISESNTSIYMVYGNNDAVAASNIDNTYILYDDTVHNVISSSYTWDIDDYEGENFELTFRSRGNYGADGARMYIYDKNEDGEEYLAYQTFTNYHSSSYNDYSYLYFYKYLEDGTSDGSTYIRPGSQRYENGYSQTFTIRKEGNYVYFYNNDFGSTSTTQSFLTDQYHDGLTKFTAAKYYAHGSSSYVYVDNVVVKNYASEPVELYSTGSEEIYDPDDFIPTDTCTYSGSGDWTIDLTDNCIIDTNYDLGVNEILLTNTGNVTFNSDISVTNFPQPATNQNIYIDSNAYILVS